MMRWKLWDIAKDGEPPQYAMHTHGNGWMVLQQEVIVKKQIQRRVDDKFFAFIDGHEWQDVPLHIESKE